MTRKFTLLGLFALCFANFLSAQEDASYTPMLEVGKEWHYTLWNTIVFEPDDPTDEGEMVIRIEGSEEIDNKTYYSVAAYFNGEKDVEQYGNCFLSEDCEEGKVYMGFMKPDGKIDSSLAYDFVNPSKGEISIKGTMDAPVYPLVYEAFGKSYNAFECGDQKRYRLVEGLGFISSSKFEKDDYSQCLGTLLDGPTLGCTGYCTIPKIYKIVDGKGETIYYLPSAAPSASSQMIDNNTNDIRITNTAIEIICAGEIGDLAVYTPTGVQVRNMYVSDTHFSLPLTDFATGVYILRTAGMSRKFTVR